MKKHMHIISFGALFLATVLLLSSLFGVAENAVLNAIEADAEICELPVLILDAGHGGEDGGATGTNGLLEKDLNLSLTQSLAALLRLCGYTVVETRTEDRLLYDAGTKKGHKKQSDLENRLAFTEKYPDSVFISIHMNTYPTANCEGAQVWYSPNHEASIAWAQAVQQHVTAILQPSNRRKIKSATSSIYILRHAKSPAILVECGFLSTPSDCERLSDPHYQQQLALALCSAVFEKTAAQS